MKETIVKINKTKSWFFEKTQHPFVIKTLQKMGIEGTYLDVVKAIYDKLQQTLFSMVKN